jgi:hypothetical protein
VEARAEPAGQWAAAVSEETPGFGHGIDGGGAPAAVEKRREGQKAAEWL